MDKEAETQYHFRTSYKAVDRNVRNYSITVLFSMFCLNCDCVLIISFNRNFNKILDYDWLCARLFVA